MTQGLPRVARRLVSVGWVVLVPLLGAFFVLRLMPGQAPLVISQVAFVFVVACTALVTWAAYAVGPPGAERRIWGLLAVAVSLLVLSEGYFSWVQITAEPAGPRGLSAFDVVNAFAALAIVLAISIPFRLARLGRPTRLRLDADFIAVVSIVYIGVYHFWARNLVADSNWASAAVWAAYSVLGGVMLIGVGWMAVSARITPDRRTATLLYWGIGIFGAGMLVAPAWLPATLSSPGTGWAISAEATTYLAAYCCVLLAAMMRVADADGPWRVVAGRPLSDDDEWLSTALSAVVLVTVGLIGWWLYHAAVPPPDTLLYVVIGTIVTLTLVARTGFASVETGILRDTSSLDPVTGALNHRAFLERTESQSALVRRGVERFALCIIDVDGFARVNTALGHSRGDLVLAEVARSLRVAAGPDATVFRLTADEFGVIGSGVASEDALAFGECLADAVRRIRPSRDIQLSASAGVSVCEDEGCSAEMVVRRAEMAQVWAKYHGKDRVVLHDERIVRALGVEERVHLSEERSHLGMARALATAADARDPRNIYHSRNVAALCVLVCDELGMEPEHTRAVEIAAMLHDVGKIALPDALVIETPLSPRDAKAAEEHAALGARLVESLDVEGVAQWVRWHHERWDGTGYPDGLVGGQIPTESRIIALANAYDCMTSPGHGRTVLSKRAALQSIDHGMGLEFDPRLAETFIRLVGTTPLLGWSDDWAVVAQ